MNLSTSTQCFPHGNEYYEHMVIEKARLNCLVAQVETNGRQCVSILSVDHFRLPFRSRIPLSYLSRDGVLIPSDRTWPDGQVCNARPGSRLIGNLAKPEDDYAAIAPKEYSSKLLWSPDILLRLLQLEPDGPVRNDVFVCGT